MRSSVSAAMSGMLGWAVIVGGCAGDPAPAPRPAASSGAEQSPGHQSPTDLAHHMRASFADAVQARDALIAGELVKAQQAADRLANFDYAPLLPQDWKHWIDRLHQSAQALSIAPNLDDAAQELGRLALVCGDCHDLHQTGPTRPRSQPLPWRDPPEAFDARMHRHQLGVAQLWDGLVLPSESAWRNGTITITRAPLNAPETAADATPIDEPTHARIEAVRALAKDARTASTYEKRGHVFGEIVARCANCHLYERPAK